MSRLLTLHRGGFLLHTFRPPLFVPVQAIPISPIQAHDAFFLRDDYNSIVSFIPRESKNSAPDINAHRATVYSRALNYGRLHLPDRFSKSQR